MGKAILGQKSSRCKENKSKKEKKTNTVFRGWVPASGAVRGMRGRWCLRRRGRGRVEMRISGHFHILLQRQRGERGGWKEVKFHPQRFHRLPGGIRTSRAAPPPRSWHGRGARPAAAPPSSSPRWPPGAILSPGRRHFVKLPPPPPVFVRQIPSFFVLISLPTPLTKRAALKTPGGG